MTVEDGIKSFLMASPYPIAVENRVFSHKAPQASGQSVAEPYLVIYRISPTPRHVHAGPVPVIERLFQFSIFGRSQSAVLECADALRRLMDGYRGPMGSYDVSGVFWSGERMLLNETSGMHQAACDYRIHYREP